MVKYLKDPRGIVHERAKYIDDQHSWQAATEETQEATVTCLECLSINLNPDPWIANLRTT